MRVETNIMGGVAISLFVAAGVYGAWAQEPVGTVCLVLSGALCGMIAVYFGFIARRIDRRPEDDKNAEVSDGSGVVGFFSPWSYWPLGVAISASVVVVGLSFLFWWLVIIGVLMLLITAAGLLFEYYIGLKA